MPRSTADGASAGTTTTVVVSASAKALVPLSHPETPETDEATGRKYHRRRADDEQADGRCCPLRPVVGRNPLAFPPVRGGHGGRRRDDGASYPCDKESSSYVVGAPRKKSPHRSVRFATSRSPPGPRGRPPTILLGVFAGACLCLLVASFVTNRGPDGAASFHRSDGGKNGSMMISSTSNEWVVDGHDAGRGHKHLRRRRLFGEVRKVGVGGGGGGAGIEMAGIDTDDAYREERPERRQQQRPKQRFSPPRTWEEESEEEGEFAATNNDEDGNAGGLQPPSLFPLSSNDLWGLALAVVGLMLAAGGGVGGGGILVPIYTLVLRFTPRHAIPLSNVTVFGGAVANTILNSRKRHPSADRPLVDWDLMLVMEPLTISGALIGSFVNKLLPETVLVVALVLLLGFTAYNTLRKAKRMHDKESEDWRALAGMEIESEAAEAECEGKVHDSYDDDDFHPERPPRWEEGKEQNDYLCSNDVCGKLRTQKLPSDVMETDDEIYDQQMIVDDDDFTYDEIEEELETLADRLREGLVHEDEMMGEREEPVADVPPPSPRPLPLPPPKHCKGFRPLPLLRRRSSSTVVVAASPTDHRKEDARPYGSSAESGLMRARSAPLGFREQRGDADSVPAYDDSGGPASSSCRRTPSSEEEEKKESHTPSGFSTSPMTVHFDISSLPPSKRRAYEERCRTPQLGDVELIEISYARDEYGGDAGASERDENVEADDVGGTSRSKRVIHGRGTGLWGRRYEAIAAKTTTSSSCGVAPGDDDSAVVLDRILEEERHPPPGNVCTLSMMFLVVVIVNVLKGGGAFSPLGVECGSAPFWIAEIFVNMWVLSVFAVARSYLVRRAELKRRVGYRYVDGDIKWTSRATVVYPAICCLAGFFAGMFGIGGGIVKGPLMLAMGVHPAVASATSACMILFTSLAATTSYGVFGLLVPDYAVACLGVGFVATLLGQAVMSGLLKRHGRSSYIAFSIGIVVLLSAVCMTAESVVSIVRGRDGEAGGVHDAGGLCSKVE